MKTKIILIILSGFSVWLATARPENQRSLEQRVTALEQLVVSQDKTISDLQQKVDWTIRDDGEGHTVLVTWAIYYQYAVRY